MTDGRISTYWQDVFNDSAPVLSSIGNRIIAQSGETALVYDISLDTFYTENVAGFGEVVRSFDIDKDIGFVLGVEDATAHDWEGDFETTNASDPDSGDRPRLRVTTNSIPLGESPFSRGRVNTIYINGFVEDAASDDPSFVVGVINGRTGIAEPFPEASQTAPAVFPEGGVDETLRVPMDGNKDDSHARIDILQTAPAKDARIYDIALEYRPTNVIPAG